MKVFAAINLVAATWPGEDFQERSHEVAGYRFVAVARDETGLRVFRGVIVAEAYRAISGAGNAFAVGATGLVAQLKHPILNTAAALVQRCVVGVAE